MLLAEGLDLFDFAGQLGGDDFFQILKDRKMFIFVHTQLILSFCILDDERMKCIRI